MNEECEHCPDGHDDPGKKSWAVFVSEDRDSDGQPTHLYVCPSDSSHVCESDAQWLRDLISKHRVPKGSTTFNVFNPAFPHSGSTLWNILRQHRGYGDGNSTRA